MAAVTNTYTLEDIVCMAEELIGTEGFTAVLARIEKSGRKHEVGSEKREIMRRAYAHILRLRENGDSLTGNGYIMGGRAKTAVRSEVAAVALKASAPKIGTFTVVMAGGRVTLRLKKHWVLEEAAKGTLVAYFMNGADNENDYTGFAFVQPNGKAKVWNKFRNAPIGTFRNGAAIITALEFLIQGGDYEGAGMTYALESGNCYRCNRLLTVPASIGRGLGPECAKKVN